MNCTRKVSNTQFKHRGIRSDVCQNHDILRWQGLTRVSAIIFQDGRSDLTRVSTTIFCNRRSNLYKQTKSTNCAIVRGSPPDRKSTLIGTSNYLSPWLIAWSWSLWHLSDHDVTRHILHHSQRHAFVHQKDIARQFQCPSEDIKRVPFKDRFGHF